MTEDNYFRQKGDHMPLKKSIGGYADQPCIAIFGVWGFWFDGHTIIIRKWMHH